MVVTTCFGMPTNEILYGLQCILMFKRYPGSNPACGRNFFCLDIKKFWYSCEKDNHNDVNKHIWKKMYQQKKPNY